MRVVLPLVSAAQNISGVQRHAINVARALLRNPDVTSLHLIAGSWQDYVLRALPSDSRLQVEFPFIGNTLLGRNLWYANHLPMYCRTHKADLVHYSFPAPVHRSAFTAPLVVSLHDLYPYDLPENFGRAKAIFNRAILRQCVHAVDKIACVSESTLRRLDCLMPRLSLAKAEVVPNCVERNNECPVRPQKIAATDTFLLCVGQHRCNKNLLLLLQAYCLLLRSRRLSQDTRLVIVGIKGPETSAIQRFIRKHGLQERVLLCEGITEGELHWCYQHCMAMVAPSSVEGFGLPLAEAMLAGCRIVCSDIPTFREVCADHARYVPLSGDAVSDLADAIAERCAKQKPAPILLPSFSVDAVSAQYALLYSSLLNGARRTTRPSANLVARHNHRKLHT